SGPEDEVFIGPLGHKKKCTAVSIEANKSAEEKSVPVCDEEWSQLTGEKFVEIFREAHLLALQIETGSKNEQTKKSQSEEHENKIIEKFVADSKSKLKILRNQNTKNSPRASLKRETYCVWDSPVCQLPPSFQKESDKLLSDDKTDALHAASSRRPVKICVSPAKITSSPLTQEQKTKEQNPEATAKVPLAKPLSTVGKSNSSTSQKPKQGKYTDISTRHLNSMGSAEDIISDKSCTAADVLESSCSGSTSSEDKKAFPVPNKPGLKKITHLKLPGAVSGLTRKTTSSMSSVSSMNQSLSSSLPISPAGKNGKSGMPSEVSVSGSRVSSTSNSLALVKPSRVPSLPSANAEKSRKQGRSAATPTTFSAASLTKPSASVPSSEAIGSGIQRLSSVHSLQKISQQNKDGSATKGSLCLKPKAKVLPVPTSQAKVPGKTGGTPPKKSAPKATSLGSTFCGTLGSAMAVSTPVKASEDGISQNCFRTSVPMTPASLKRSGLPTPIRRISGFPAVTPKTAPRMAFSSHAASICRSSSFSTKKTLTACSNQTKESKTQMSSPEDDISPPPLQPLALNFSPEKAATEVVENELKEAEVQNHPAEEKQTEVLLVDIGVDKSLPHTLECDRSRPLLDLSNTPEVNKITPLKPLFSGQVKLIDVSLPLITLSPDVNQENLDSPLIKF
ncbi:GTSE1 protein, partial [Centropus bengalensis]|nr:GTSE1 protein [Centropus bengalensis]